MVFLLHGVFRCFGFGKSETRMPHKEATTPLGAECWAISVASSS